MQRGFWRTEERHSKPMVHSVHKCDDRLGLCDWSFRSLFISCDLFGTTLAGGVENLPGSGCCTSFSSLMAANQASRARRIQEVRPALQKMVVELTRGQGKYETRQDSLLAGYQILLEETSRCISDLVSVRFQYLQLWHLFLDHSQQRYACGCSSFSVIWLEHGDKPFLCSRCYVRIDLVGCKKHISLFHTPSSHFHCSGMFNAPFCPSSI